MSFLSVEFLKNAETSFQCLITETALGRRKVGMEEVVKINVVVEQMQSVELAVSTY